MPHGGIIQNLESDWLSEKPLHPHLVRPHPALMKLQHDGLTPALEGHKAFRQRLRPGGEHRKRGAWGQEGKDLRVEGGTL